MKKAFVFAGLLTLSLPLTTLAQRAVSARPLSGYFLKSSVKDANEKPHAWVITDQSALEEAFGSTQPTTVNFEKESVIAVAAPETDVPTNLAVNVTQKGNELAVKYQMKPDGDKSFRRRPVRLVAVPKAALTGKEVVVYEGTEEVQRITQ
jgi:hypothetical protein